MEIEQFISNQSPERQALLTDIHAIILASDNTVVAGIEPMMGKEMIMYKAKGMMKYALASVKNYMSLHVLPMYANAPLYGKYKELLPRANFQKGCINFVDVEEMPLSIVQNLIIDSSVIDLVKLKEDYLRSKTSKK